MYWSDWGHNIQSNSHIGRAALDGTQQTIIINKVGRANGLTIDFVKERLYWADLDNNKIDSSDLNGKNKKTIIERDMPHPHTITQYQVQQTIIITYLVIYIPYFISCGTNGSKS